MTIASVIRKAALCAGLAISLSQASLAHVFPSPANAYVVVEGKVSNAGTADPVSHFYLDIYKTYPDSRRELARTGRYPGSQFRAYLELGYSHTLKFRLDGEEQATVNISAMELHEAREQGIELSVSFEQPSSAPPAPAAPVEAPPAAGLVSPEPSAGPDIPEHRKPSEAEARPAPRQAVNTMAPSANTAALPQVEKEETVPAAESAPAPADERVRKLISEHFKVPLPTQERIRLSRQVLLYREIEKRSKVLARLSAGSEVEVLERTTSKWWMVAHKGHIGWIETEVLQ